ncbi:MAG: DUF3817 domain-containing protein [Nannocystaceae bacterium]
MLNTPIGRVRVAGLAEGVSFVALVGIGMPLKYFQGMPMAVKVMGMVHGLLFLIFCATLLATKLETGWPLRRAALVFLAALLPFGPFLIDRSLKREDASPPPDAA